ncbi:formylglycine-generating enzyme family protein [Tichowtungia aerotolerans]|uniref:SUMF1/EgtB/PvdO family nonheme iron enzyme n=1 Tax=Tichowtungia aerotolerans TaxID=2697043 RepID=A0A6P1M4Z6_9BACT|nr:SUMF1/EgtB/PvdO family nonheme iron enzyme [Tichowtungia aerotolerans]QHI68921.1 SUMF1/EgtB/PvdO family nonheme iron enzyme [Tichowtungia aerotolerans]
MKIQFVSMGLIAGFCCLAQGERIAHGGVNIEMEFVTIGNPNNPAHESGFGAVPYEYQIAIHEVTADQWEQVAKKESIMNCPKAPVWKDNEPAAGITWVGAAMFCNWLTSGDALEGAYHFDEFGTLMAIDRELALKKYDPIYVLPSEDEWVKAAYYNGFTYSKFANGAETAPPRVAENRTRSENVWAVGSGVFEQNGTYDMGGNLAEWTESAFDGGSDYSSKRATRDAAYRFGTTSSIEVRTGKDSTAYASSAYGFRVVKVNK